MSKISITVCAAAIVGLAACKKNNDNNTNSKGNATDQTFVQQVALGNSAEVQLGQLAALKGTDTAVKAFGKFMVTEHTTAQSDLKTVGAGMSMNVPDSIDAQHQAMMQQLMGLSGRAFDSVYINGQVADHNKTLTIFKTEIDSGSNQSVKGYANLYAPHIQMHLKMADSISHSL